MPLGVAALYFKVQNIPVYASLLDMEHLAVVVNEGQMVA